MNRLQEIKKLYRCGYCGAPCEEDGSSLSMSMIGLAKDLERYDQAEQVHGECCRPEAEQREMVQITRDMACDAQDMSLEGQWIEW